MELYFCFFIALFSDKTKFAGSNFGYLSIFIKCIPRKRGLLQNSFLQQPTFGVLSMGKLAAIICLNHIRCIAEASDCTLHKITVL